MPILSHFIIQLNKETILKNLGYKISLEISKHFLERMIEEEMENTFSLIDPKGIYESFPIQIEKGYTIDIKEGFRISSKKLSKWLGDSTHLAVMAVTIGDRLEKKASDLLRRGESARGYILDAIGSHAVERVAELMEQKIRRESDFRNKKRFSCGYSDWDLSDQKKILDLIKGEQIGIKVNKNSMMIPKKSITAVIGIY